MRQHEVDAGHRDGVTSETAAEIRALKRRNADLERTVEILKAATSFFVRESDPHAADLRVHRANRDRFGVAPICRVLTEHGAPIAPRTFHAWAARAPSKRALWAPRSPRSWSATTSPTSTAAASRSRSRGSLKMWAHLRRQGIPVARCTVERLMRANGWHGARRQAKVRTTIADPAAERAPDLVDREFTVDAPNRLFVADFTYVRLIVGVFVYVAFVIDAYAGTIVGWEAEVSPL